MRLFSSFALALYAFSCAQQQPESSTNTSSIDHGDTLAADTSKNHFEDSEYENFDYKVAPKSRFKKNQIREGVFYVFDPNGSKFETANGNILLAAGSEAIVTSEFDKSITDENTNAVGYLFEITDAEGITGMISSASLVSLPYPDRKYASLEEYALNHLNQIDSARYSGIRHKTDPDSGFEGEYKQIDYAFENGIKLTISNSYEAATEFMDIPGITVQDGFYILNAIGIIDLFSIFDGKIPNKQLENAEFKNSDESIEVDSKINSDGSLAYLAIGPASGGCGCWYSISNQVGFIQIEVGCGC